MTAQMVLILCLTSALSVRCHDKMSTMDLKLGLFLEDPDGSEMSALRLSLEFIRNSWNPLRGVNISLISRQTQGKNHSQSITKVCEILHEGVSGLLTLSSCDTLKLLRSQQEVFHMPHLAVYTGHCSGIHRNSFTLSLRENGGYTITAIDQLISYMEWRKVAVFYDDTFEMSQIKSLLFTLSSHFVESSVVYLHRRNLSQPGYIEQKLHSLVKRLNSRTIYFLLLLNENNILQILKMARKMNLLTRQNFWIVVNKDILTLPTDLGADEANIALVVKKWPNSACTTALSSYVSERLPDLKPKEAYLIDATTALADVVYSKLGGNIGENISQYIDCSSKPIIPWEQGALVMDELRQLNSTGLSGALYFDADGYNGNTEHEILSLQRVRGSREFISVGLWNKHSGLQIQGNGVFKYSLDGFNNITFKIGTKEAKPFVYVNRNESGTTIDGFCVDILNELATRLNFRYELFEPLDGVWGSEEKNGSFNGIVGMVNRKELDFGIGPFSITAERERGIDFTTPFMEDGIGIVMRRPAEESKNTYRMFQPFSWYVWLSVGGSVTVIGLVLFILNRYSPTGKGISEYSNQNGRQYGFRESLWLIFASLMEQGGDSHPVAVSSRLMLGFWWIFTILIVSSYTANLAAFLTVTKVDKPLDTLEDLAYNQEIMPLVKTGTNIYSLFRTGTNDVYKEIWRKIQSGPVLTDNSVAYDYVRTGKYAFMVDKTQLEYLVKRDCQTFMLADESFNNAGVGFVFQENSPMLHDISYHIIRMQEAGLIERWRQKWWPSSDTCSTSGPASQAKRLSLDGTGGPFIIFAGAAAVAFLCLILEITFARRHRALNIKNLHTSSNSTAK